MPKFLRTLGLICSVFFILNPQLHAQDTTANEERLSDRLSPEYHKKKRDELRETMPDRSVALLFSGSEKVRSNDVYYEFHQDPNFYYLTGLREPDALLILFKEPFDLGDKQVKELMFVPGRSKSHEIWHGKRLGTLGVIQDLGFEAAKVNTQFADFEIDFSYFDRIYYNMADGSFDDDNQNRGDIASMVKHFHLKTDTLNSRKDDGLLSFKLNYMREIKDEEEIQLLKKAIDITCEAQKELMKAMDSTYTEYRAEALIEYTFRDLGASGPGFPSIVGGGKNSCVLHYIENNGDLNNGDLLVVDIGAEYESYSADITRTIPVSGTYSEEQAAIYNVVLNAQRAGIELCKPGYKFWEPGEAATKEIQKGLMKLGIIKRSYEYKKYFMHGTSHYLGLDVHDAGSYEPLKAGNVITVEPGIYIPEGSDCDKKWWNIGVRIEDDVLITEDGPVILSDCVPSEIPEIEALMAGEEK